MFVLFLLFNFSSFATAAVHYNQLHNVVGRSTSSTPFSDRELLGYHAKTDRHWHHLFFLSPSLVIFDFFIYKKVLALIFCNQTRRFVRK